MNTLLLDQSTGDLVKDISGNIALAGNPYSIAQDVASACKTFYSELWYDTLAGVPFLQQILGQLPPAGFVKAQLVKAALTVPGVLTATCYLTGFTNRNLIGQIQITTTTQTLTINFNTGGPVPWYVSGVSPDAAA